MWQCHATRCRQWIFLLFGLAVEPLLRRPVSLCSVRPSRLLPSAFQFEPLEPPLRPTQEPRRSVVAVALSQLLVLSNECSRNAAVAAPLRSSKVLRRVATTDGGEVVDLASGVEFSDFRVGGGAIPQLGEGIVLHVRGFLNEENDPIFIDTYASDAPLFFALGTRPDGITEGLEEAIATMHAGSVRVVQVPSYLGYPDGVARVAVKPPLLRPVPTRTVLRYEIELLRCLDISLEGLNGTQRLCCPEPQFPCKVPS